MKIGELNRNSKAFLISFSKNSIQSSTLTNFDKRVILRNFNRTHPRKSIDKFSKNSSDSEKKDSINIDYYENKTKKEKEKKKRKKKIPRHNKWRTDRWVDEAIRNFETRCIRSREAVEWRQQQ